METCRGLDGCKLTPGQCSLESEMIPRAIVETEHGNSHTKHINACLPLLPVLSLGIINLIRTLTPSPPSAYRSPHRFVGCLKNMLVGYTVLPIRRRMCLLGVACCCWIFPPLHLETCDYPLTLGCRVSFCSRLNRKLL